MPDTDKDVKRSHGGGGRRDRDEMEVALNISPATPADLPLIVKYGKEFHDKTKYSSLLTYDSGGFGEAIFTVINRRYGMIWLAWLGEEFVGAIFATITPNMYDPNQLIGHIAFHDILPKHQGKGFGKRMLDVAVDWMKGSGVSVLSHDVYSPKQIKSMKSSGWKQVETKMMIAINGTMGASCKEGE